MPAKKKSPSHSSRALPDGALELIAATFRALSEPVRLRLLSELMNGERSVGQLVEISGTGQANVSKHLALLREAGIVATRRDGLATICRIADPVIYELCELMCAKVRDDAERRAAVFR